MEENYKFQIGDTVESLHSDGTTTIGKVIHVVNSKRVIVEFYDSFDSFKVEVDTDRISLKENK